MSKFKIELREGDEYITNLENNFTLKVIPPEKQPGGYELGRQVVGASLTVMADYLLFGVDNKSYDFESLDNGFYDDNRNIWYETIEYYCKLVLDATPEHYTPYNFEADLTEENCTPECWAALHAPSSDVKTRTLEVNDKTIEIIPGFNKLEKAMEEGVLEYQLFNHSENADFENIFLGKLLYDLEDNWIYEGKVLSAGEQKQVADFILNESE